MIPPKDLYRELAALLADIDIHGTKDALLFSVLAKLEHSFARDLHIHNGRLYVEDLDRFLPLKPPNGQSPGEPDRATALDAEAVHHIITHGSYIFNNPSVAINRHLAPEDEDTIAAAIMIGNPENRWIVVFGLKRGWVREEVELCLSAVRALLNFRLHSDAMRSDIKQAALIQQSLLPSNPPYIAGYETSGLSYPAEVVGGDFFDFSIFDDSLFSTAVGDASEHGLPAALLVRDVVTGLRMGVEKEMRMADAMQKLNRVIHRSTLSARFVSLFYAEIETNGNILYVNAGHPPPPLVHGSRVEPLKATGMILGAVPEITIQRDFAHFQPGAVLAMYTDGLLERLNNQDQEYGLARLTDLLVRHQAKSAQEIVDLIYQAVFNFGSQAKWRDDFTAVVVKKVE